MACTEGGSCDPGLRCNATNLCVPSPDVDDGGASRTVTVRAETQYCPPNATVFDRCTASASKVVPKSVQDKIAAIGARLAR